MATWQQMYPKLAAAVAANPNAPGAATMLSGWLANGVDPSDPAVADWMNANESAISASSPQGNFAGNPFDGYPALKAYFAQFPDSPLNWTNSDTGQLPAVPGLIDQLEKSAEMVYQQNGVPVGGQLPASVGKIQSLQNGDALQQTYTTGPGAGNFNTTGGNAFGALQSTLADIKTPLMIAGLMAGGVGLANAAGGGATAGASTLADAGSTLPASYWNTVAGELPSGGISTLADASAFPTGGMSTIGTTAADAAAPFVGAGTGAPVAASGGAMSTTGALQSAAAGGGFAGSVAGGSIGSSLLNSLTPSPTSAATSAASQALQSGGSSSATIPNPNYDPNSPITEGNSPDLPNPDYQASNGTGLPSLSQAATGTSALAKLLGISDSAASALGAGGTTLAGLLGANAQSNTIQNIFNQQRADRQPALNAFNNALANPDSFYQTAPAMGAADAAARALSVNGNPAWNPTSSAKLAANNLGGYNAYLNNLSGPAFGGQSTQAQLGTALAGTQGQAANAVAGGLGNLTTPTTDIATLLKQLGGLGNLGNAIPSLNLTGNS